MAGVLATGAAIVAVLIAALLGASGTDPLPERIAGVAAVVAFATGGAFILRVQHPRNIAGLLFLGFALSEATVQLTVEWSRRALLEEPGSLPGGIAAAWVYGWAWVLPSFLPLFIVLVFPDGLLPGRFWTWTARVGATALGVLVVASALYPRLFADQEGWPTDLDNPLGLSGATPVLDVVTAGSMGVLAFVALVTVVSPVIRWRVADDQQRQRLRLVVLPALLVALVGVTGGPDLLLIASTAALAVSATIAVSRHGIEGAQIAVSRSLVLAALGALTTAAYFGLVVLTGSIFGGRDGDLPLGVGAAALAATAFQPLRAGVERRARRLVVGPRGDPYRLVAELTRDLADSRIVDSGATRIADAVQRSLDVDTVEIRAEGLAGHAGAPLDDARSPTECVDLRHESRTIGTLAVFTGPGRWTDDDSALLRDLATVVAPSIATTLLNQELRERARDLADSRRRIVVTAERERRRMERDLHDGAQQHLVALAANLGRLTRRLEAHTELRQLAMGAADQADEAMSALRDLARGVYPHVLVDHGVLAALRNDADHDRYPFGLEIAGVAGRCDPDLEAAVYFCCKEAIQNATKHARARAVSVRVDVTEHVVRLQVRDDGSGIPTGTSDGQGFTNIRDRVGAFSGRLWIDSGAGGTTVTAEIPRGSGTLTEEQQHRTYAPMDVGFGGESHLGEDGGDVLLDRPRGQVELASDAGVAVPTGHRLEHLPLPVGEVTEHGVVGARPGGDE